MLEWRARDPLLRSRAVIGDEAADAIEAEVETVIADALEFARSSPVTGVDLLSLDHYANA